MTPSDELGQCDQESILGKMRSAWVKKCTGLIVLEIDKEKLLSAQVGWQAVLHGPLFHKLI